jgi:hypothetical protein
MKRILTDMNFNNVNILTADACQAPWKTPNFSYLNPFHPFDKSTTTAIIYQQLFYNHRQSYHSYDPVFTDGSKSEDYVGCSYVIKDKAYSHRLHPALSIFSAEILAIVKALEELNRYQSGILSFMLTLLAF